MEVPSSENEQTLTNSEITTVTKPVPRPFSIEALMSDCGPKRNSNVIPWNITQPLIQHNQYQMKDSRDTDSDGSLDMELAQDLSNRSQKDSKYFIIFHYFKLHYCLTSFYESSTDLVSETCVKYNFKFLFYVKITMVSYCLTWTQSLIYVPLIV